MRSFEARGSSSGACEILPLGRQSASRSWDGTFDEPPVRVTTDIALRKKPNPQDAWHPDASSGRRSRDSSWHHRLVVLFQSTWRTSSVRPRWTHQRPHRLPLRAARWSTAAPGRGRRTGIAVSRTPSPLPSAIRRFQASLGRRRLGERAVALPGHGVQFRRHRLDARRAHHVRPESYRGVACGQLRRAASSHSPSSTSESPENPGTVQRFPRGRRIQDTCVPPVKLASRASQVTRRPAGVA